MVFINNEHFRILLLTGTANKTTYISFIIFFLAVKEVIQMSQEVQ